MILPQWYASACQTLQPAPSPAWRAQRALAQQYLMAHGLPAGRFGQRTSFWQYTDLAAWVHVDAESAETVPAMPAMLGQPDAMYQQSHHLCQLQQGVCTVRTGDQEPAWDQGSITLCEGVVLYDLAQCSASVWEDCLQGFDLALQDGMSALNWALTTQLYCLRVAPNTQVSLPVVWQHAFMGKVDAQTQIRLFVEVGEGSCITVHESHEGACDRHWQQVHVDWHLQRDAKVQLYQSQQLAGAGVRQCVHHHARQAAGSQWHVQCLQLGADHARHVFVSDLLGEGAVFEATGLACLKGRQQHDWVVRANHLAPKTTSRVHGRSLVDDHAVHACNAKVHVAPGASQSEAHQQSHNLLLSDRARAHAKPALVIHHDDVVCSHGATVGALSEEAMFFLRSRGLSASLAHQVLVMAFANVLLDVCASTALREDWYRLCQAALGAVHDVSEVQDV